MILKSLDRSLEDLDLLGGADIASLFDKLRCLCLELQDVRAGLAGLVVKLASKLGLV